MKWILLAIACLPLSACNAVESGGTPMPAVIVPETFLGLEIGSVSNLPQCSRYTKDGDYKVPSLQEVTPCLARSTSQVIAIDGVPVQADPDEPEHAGVLFGIAQVPAGIGTTGHAVLQRGLLAEVSVAAEDDISPTERQAILRLLIDKYGMPDQERESDDLTWALEGMTVFSLPADRGRPAQVKAASREYLQWQRSRSGQVSAGSF